MMLADLPLTVVEGFLHAFMYNLVIAILAMALGCPIGYLLGYMAGLPGKTFKIGLKMIRSLFCNVPSFVLLFYFTLMVPSRLEILGGVWTVSPLSKSILALSIPVIGYYSELFEQIIKGEGHFSLSTFKQFFIVILMASTTASVIGVPEIMASANAYIASRGDSSMMLLVYLVVASIFVVSGLLIQALFYMASRLYCAVSGEKGSRREDESDEENTINPSA